VSVAQAALIAGMGRKGPSAFSPHLDPGGHAAEGEPAAGSFDRIFSLLDGGRGFMRRAESRTQEKYQGGRPAACGFSPVSGGTVGE